jgi:DNA primase
MPASDAARAERCRTLMAILLRHPGLLHDVEEALGTITVPAPLARLREEILRWARRSQTLDSDGLLTHLTQTGLAEETARALSAVPYPLPACTRPDAQAGEAEEGWWHFFGLLNPDRLEEDVASATRAFTRQPDEAAQRRLTGLCTARDALRRGDQGQDADL